MELHGEARVPIAPLTNGVNGLDLNTSTSHMSRFKATTGFVYDECMLAHREKNPEDDEGAHPEAPVRIQRIYEELQGAGYTKRMYHIAIRAASQAEVMLIHSPELWHRVQSFSGWDDIHIEATKAHYQRQSLYVNQSTSICARFSLGGTIETCRAVAEGLVRNAFAIVRPPGHHAEPEQEQGFCFYNNVAVAAEFLKKVHSDKIKRILILDWDVHHGNGTQKAFWTDPDVLYISLHEFQMGTFYPGGPAGAANQVGEGSGTGRNVNIPWEEDHMGDADYLYAFQKIVMPIAYEFAPDFIIVSAGFDAALGDDLGQCDVTPAGFAHMTHMLSSLANGKLVLALEGGYNVDAIAKSALECTKVLLGEYPPQLPPMVASESATQVIYAVSLEQNKHWKCITPGVAEPREEIEKAVATVSLAQVLKAHRAHQLYHSAKMINIELADENLQNLFEDQVFCTEDIFESQTLVVFMHDMGTIHAEVGTRDFEVQVEKAYILDTSADIINWAKTQKFAIIDINSMLKVPIRQTRLKPVRSAEMNEERKLALFIWDHFVSISRAKQVIFIGMGSGCGPLTYIINTRTRDVEERLKASIMVCGRQPPALISSDTIRPGLRNWYYPISRIICASTHEFLDQRHANDRRYGNLHDSNESRPLYILRSAWPSISSFIAQTIQSNS